MIPVRASKPPRTVCDVCGNAMPVAHAVYDGKGYCGTCYKRLTVKTVCSGCGKNVRRLPGMVAICKKCRTIGRLCVRCGKGVPKAAFTLENGEVTCPSCACYYKKPRECTVCGQLDIHVHRDYKNGFTEPACGKCRRRKGHINCPCCLKNRPPAGQTSAGIVVCKACLDVDGKPFLCPICGKEGFRHSKTMCSECYWRKNAEKKAYDIVVQLRNDWLKSAFQSFIRELIPAIGASTTITRIKRYFIFFAMLDALGLAQTEITSEILVTIFSTVGMKNYAIPFGYMTKNGLLPTVNKERLIEEDEKKRQLEFIAVHEPGWVKDLLVAFHAHLLAVQNRYRKNGWVGDRQRFVPNTITKAMRVASLFLHYASSSCHTLQQIDQNILDQFAVTYSGYKATLLVFIRFFNKQKVFKKLKIVSVRRNLSPESFLTYSRYTELLQKWLFPDDKFVRESLICLLMLFYAQTIKRTVELKMSVFRKGQDGIYYAKFAKAEIEIDNKLSELLDRYLNQRKALSPMEADWENEYLFPGMRRGGHLNVGTVDKYLKKYNVTAQELFSSAIYYVYLAGMRHPKALVKAFGITDVTAVKYLDIINPRLRDEVEKMSRKNPDE